MTYHSLQSVPGGSSGHSRPPSPAAWSLAEGEEGAETQGVADPGPGYRRRVTSSATTSRHCHRCRRRPDRRSRVRGRPWLANHWSSSKVPEKKLWKKEKERKLNFVWNGHLIDIVNTVCVKEDCIILNASFFANFCSLSYGIACQVFLHLLLQNSFCLLSFKRFVHFPRLRWYKSYFSVLKWWLALNMRFFWEGF